MKQDIPKPPLTETLPNFFSYQLPKIYLHFPNKNSLMEGDTFDFKSIPAFLLKLYPLHYFIITPYMLLNRKAQKTANVWRSSRWNKAERNITHLYLC